MGDEMCLQTTEHALNPCCFSLLGPSGAVGCLRRACTSTHASMQHQHTSARTTHHRQNSEPPPARRPVNPGRPRSRRRIGEPPASQVVPAGLICRGDARAGSIERTVIAGGVARGLYPSRRFIAGPAGRPGGSLFLPCGDVRRPVNSSSINRRTARTLLKKTPP
jgi:hypothetical protein